ncbi:MAG TPA: hypothetical protein VN157_04925 [Caulobacter sp.]|nr:hypothetical protein [Caulobacter sp.]
MNLAESRPFFTWVQDSGVNTDAPGRSRGDGDATALRSLAGRPGRSSGLIERLRIGPELTQAPREAYYGGRAKGRADWPTLARNLIQQPVLA